MANGAATMTRPKAQVVPPNASVVVEKPPSPSETLANGEVLDAWKATASKVRKEAEDLLCYAEELWYEDKNEWAAGKLKVLRDRESVELFDQEMAALKDRQSPVWDVIVDSAGDLFARLEESHERVKTSHNHIKAALQEDPLNRRHLNPLDKVFGKTLHQDQQELHHHYHRKMVRQFREADDEYKAVCAYPSGLLERIRFFHVNAIKQSADLVEGVHKKKGSGAGPDSCIV